VSPIATINNEQGQATRRLIRLFESATDEELAYGLTWYGEAHDEAEAIAQANDRQLHQVAGVIAALSPRTSWPDNLRKTRQLLETGDTYGLTNGRDKAKRILDGEDPLDVLSGNKTRAFYDNLADPVNSTEVTVDAHAYDAAIGFVAGDRQRKALERKGEYERVADMFRSAARYLGVAPHVAQAVIWTVWRNRYGLYHYQKVSET
jgi:hypothetical protein